MRDLQHFPAPSPRSSRGAIHRVSSSATSGPMRTPRPSASRLTTRGTSDVHDTGTMRRTPSSRSMYTALSPYRCNTPTVSPCQGCTARVIVAVECHRACSEDDVVWLEPLQLLAFLGLGGHARTQRESTHLAHRAIERLITGRQRLQRKDLAPPAFITTKQETVPTTLTRGAPAPPPHHPRPDSCCRQRLQASPKAPTFGALPPASLQSSAIRRTPQLGWVTINVLRSPDNAPPCFHARQGVHRVSGSNLQYQMGSCRPHRHPGWVRLCRCFGNSILNTRNSLAVARQS